MKKRSMEYLLRKSTRRMRILGVAMATIIAVVGASYYISVVSPSFAKAFSGNGQGSSENPYQITNCAQLQEIQLSPTAQYVLTSDVDCSDTVNWNQGAGFEPIINFSARLDGRNYAIKDLYISRSGTYSAGLFASLLSGSEVKNLWFTKSEANAERIDINGAKEVGSIAGSGRGTNISNVHSSLNVRSYGAAAGGTDAFMDVGGLIGSLAGSMQQSSSTGSVTVDQNDQANRGVNIGGLVGQLYNNEEYGASNIIDSFATGDVWGGEGAQTPGGSCGGFVGKVRAESVNGLVEVKHSYASGSVTCQRTEQAPATGAFVGFVSSGDAVLSVPVIKENFATGLVAADTSGYGFYGVYGDSRPVEDQVVFTSNKYDVSRTGKTSCGPDIVQSNLQCTGVNLSNSRPDYFSASNFDGFYSNWDQVSIWQLDTPYPTQKVQTVRPDGIFDLEITRDGDDFIVGWTTPAPDNGRNANITGFEVFYANVATGDGNDFQLYVPATPIASDATSVRVTGLTIPGKYNFRVRALIQAQSGLQGITTQFATGMPATAPANLTVEAKSKLAQLSWSATESATSYQVEYRKVGEEAWTIYPYMSQQTTEGVVRGSVLGLDPQTVYEFRVTAMNVAGQGPWSEPVIATTTLPTERLISNCQQLQDIANDIEANYVLAGNIDCSGISNFEPIQFFIGSLDGRGYTISNISISKDIQIDGEDIHAMGLFGIVADATIKNITIKDSAVIANYVLADDVDTDQNGLPDAPVVDPLTVTTLDGVPASTADVQDTILGLQAEIAPQIVEQTQAVTQEAPTIANEFAKVSTGGLAGVAVAGGSYTNIKVLNTTVSGGLAGGVFGALLPLSGVKNIPSLGTLAESHPPIVIDGLQSSGLVYGNMAGGLIGAASSSVASIAGAPGTLTIQNSSSSSEIQANVGGGLIGTAISLSIGQGAFTASEVISSGEDIYGNQEFLKSVFSAVSTQDVVIKNSFATGTVSSCEATSAIRLGVLGGLVGIGVGTSIQSSYSTGTVKTCSGTTSNWGIYGGFMGGLGGVMFVSRIQDSYSTGNIEAIENSSSQQFAPGIFAGATGGLAGLNITLADDSDGRYAVVNSYSKGDTIITGKQGLVGISGGINGVHLGTGTIQNSYSTGKIVHVAPEQNLFSLSVSGGVNGMTVGVDTSFMLRTAWTFPQVSTPVHGIDIRNSYAKGDVIFQKSDKGGNLAVSGGLLGLFVGSGTVQTSHATGNVTNNLPEDVRIRLASVAGNPEDNPTVPAVSDIPVVGEFTQLFIEAIPALGSSKYGAAISGGLIGSAYGVDVPAIGSLVGVGFNSQGRDTSSFTLTQGLVVDNSYQTGNVKGNLAGGLIGSADFKIKINKTYSDGNVEGAITGGLIGQSGLLTTVAHAAMGFGSSLIISNAQANDDEQEIPNIMGLFDKGREALGTLDISNTYTTGTLTGTPGLAVLEGQRTVLGQTVSEIPAPGALPTTVGGLVGLSASPGQKIANSYASGDIRVLADPAYNPDPNWKVKLPKIPSFAGGLIGIDLAIPQLNFFKVYSDVVSTEGRGLIESADRYQSDVPKLENVFSASKISLSSSTFTGGAVGVFFSPLTFVDALILGREPGSMTVEEIATFKNIYVDKSRISVEGCGGPDKLWSEVADDFMSQLFVPDENGTNKVNTTDIRKAINEDLASMINPLLVKPACEYANPNNTQPDYFKQNKINTPMNQWNFNDVWVVRKNDYPKFVAGVSVCETNCDPQPPVDPRPRDRATPVSSPVTKAFESLLRPTDRNNIKKADYNWLQLLLRRIPPLLARSIPYLLIMLVLILAARYARQALKQYRQLQVYHRNILRILSTKAAIDDYLAITTHYLNTPAAVMGGAIELLGSLKKIPASLGATLGAKVKAFANEASKLENANQVSGAETANVVKPIQRKQLNPLRERAVWLPSVVALSLLLLANVLFIYAGVYNNSVARIAIEVGLMLISIFLLALSYRYRATMEQNKLLAKQQLEEESKFYEKRQSFIAHAAIVTHDNHLMLEAASNDLKKIPESKLFFNGLNMLGGIAMSLANLKKFAKVSDNPPLFDVTSYTNKAVQDVQEAAKAKNITITANVPKGIVMRVEADEMKQIVGSVLNNAVKFGKENGKVELTITRSYSKLFVKIVDNGIGISREKLPSLLKPFTRGTDSMEYNYEGVGLSLYTNKVLLDKLGGKIAIESHLNKGTTTNIELPAEHDAKAIIPMIIASR